MPPPGQEGGRGTPPLSAQAVLDLAPVLPVVIVPQPRLAVPLARALVAGGIAVMEVTARTPGALEAVALVAEGVPEMTVGVGTVLDGATAERAVASGAQFLVTPGTTPELLVALARTEVPVLPGASTVSEMMELRAAGYRVQKFFPAAASGGPAALSAVAGPLPDLRFCPTGGVTAATAADWLGLPNVACVGGTWIATPAAVLAADWEGIAARAAEVRAA